MNAAFGFTWITLGLLGGAVLGLRFDEEGWLGGYNSFRRRLLRLGHIATIMLGLLNVLFALSAKTFNLTIDGSLPGAGASWLWIIGAVAMPIVCVACAFAPKLKMAFALPVLSLVGASGLTGFLLWNALG